MNHLSHEILESSEPTDSSLTPQDTPSGSAEIETTDACPVDHSCSFCRTTDQVLNPEFHEMHNCSPLVPIKGFPEKLLLMLDCYPLGHCGAHVLIAPASHVTSLGQLEDQESLKNAVQLTTDFLRKLFPDHWLLAFEHGAGKLDSQSVKCGGCHVDHAHGHLVVLSREVQFDEILSMTESVLSDLGWNLDHQRLEAQAVLSGFSDFTGTSPYLHLGAAVGDRSFSFTYKQVVGSRAIPSQLVRRCVGTAFGRPQANYWNWKLAVKHGIEKRLREYRSAISEFKKTAINVG